MRGGQAVFLSVWVSCGCAKESTFRLASDGAVDAPTMLDGPVISDAASDDLLVVPDVPVATCDPPDGALCSPVRSRGCSAGRGCYVTPTNRICVVGGTSGWGDECSSADACRPGFVCYFNQCIKACCSDDDCTSVASGGRPDTYCSRAASDVIEYGACLPTTCDRLAVTTNNGCPRFAPYCGFSATLRASRCIPHSVVPPRAAGEMCSADNNCEIGFVCASATGTDFVCRRSCNVNKAMLGGIYACPNGFTCVRSGSMTDGSGACLPE